MSQRLDYNAILPAGMTADSRFTNLSNAPSECPSATAPRVACGVCQHEIPLSVAVSAEASEYVMYFCGLECFEQWRNRTGGM